jgi:hypothetical protein
MTTYSGGCQCGKVRYSVVTEIKEAMACNCSRCGKLGSLLAFAPASAFTLQQGEDATTAYRFNKHKIDHLFCATCGIQSFARGTGPDGTQMIAINIRSIDDLDLAAIPVKTVDGRSF